MHDNINEGEVIKHEDCNLPFLCGMTIACPQNNFN
jgi:hypothetical protein